MSAATTATPRGARKVRVGIVVSDRMMKTRIVKVERLVRHARYPKTVRRATKFKVHDETNSAKIGDWVKIMETRPLSKDKRWRLVGIVRKAPTAEPVPTTTFEFQKPKPHAPEQPQAPETAA